MMAQYVWISAAFKVIPQKDLIAELFIGFAKILPGHCRTESQVIIFGMVSFKAKNQISHAIPRGELTENHAKHLLPAGKGPDIFVSFMLIYDAIEDSKRKKICKLSEDVFALIHGLLLISKQKSIISIQIGTL